MTVTEPRWRDDLLGESPLVAAIARDALSALEREMAAGDARRKGSRNAERLRAHYADLARHPALVAVVRERVARCAAWGGWGPDARAAYVAQAAAPFGVDDGLRDELVASSGGDVATEPDPARVRDADTLVAHLRALAREGADAAWCDALAEALATSGDGDEAWSRVARAATSARRSQRG